MKYILTLTALSLSLSLFAAPLEVESTLGANMSLATVENSIVVESFEGGRMGLVQTDNGGSSDIGSLLAPSQLFLTYFQDGEEFNIMATFNIGSLRSLKTAKLKGTKIEVEADLVGANRKPVAKKFTIDIKNLKEEAKKTTGDMELGNVLIKAKVIVSEDISASFQKL